MALTQEDVAPISARNRRRCLIEVVLGYTIIISLFFIAPSFKGIWVILIFAYMCWLWRAGGPQDPDKKYIFKFFAFGNSGMGSVTKYMDIVMTILIFITVVTLVILAFIICYTVSIFVPGLESEKLFVNIGLPVFLIPSIFVYRYYDRYLGWGEKLNLFFTKRFLRKLWKRHVKSLNNQEIEFLLKNIRRDEPLCDYISENLGENAKGMILRTERWKNRIIIEKIDDKVLSESLLSKYIIQQIPSQEKIGNYFIMKWIEDYIKLSPEVLNNNSK